MDQQIAKSGHACQPVRQIIGDDATGRQNGETRSVAVGGLMQHSGCKVVANGDCGFNGHLQPILAGVHRIFIDHKFFPWTVGTSAEAGDCIPDFSGPLTEEAQVNIWRKVGHPKFVSGVWTA
jgi:hypothetical protein